MSQSISIGAIFGLFGTIASLIFVLLIVNMVNSALVGDTEAVQQDLEKIKNDTIEDAKTAPLQPFVPYIIGGVAIVLTAICGVLGIPLVFKK